MKKNSKIKSTQDTLILLYENSNVKVINSNDILKYIGGNDITAVIVPLEKYDSYNYMMVDPDVYLYPKIDMCVTGTLAVQGFEYGYDYDNNGNGFYEIISDFRLDAKNITELCSMIESLSILSYSNDIINPDYSDEFYLFSLDKTSISFSMNKRDVINSMDNKGILDRVHSSDDYGSISRVIDRINDVFSYGTTGKTSKNFKLCWCEYDFIVIKNGMWMKVAPLREIKGRSIKRFGTLLCNDDVIGISLPTLGTYTFMPYMTFRIIRSFLSSNAFLMVTAYEQHPNADFDIDKDEEDVFQMTAEMFEEFPDTFDSIYDYQYNIYSVPHLIELLSNFKHVANAIGIFIDKIFGTIVSDILFSLVVYGDSTMLPIEIKTKQKRYEFRYEITRSRLDTVGDILNDMVSTFIKTMT